MKNPTLVLNCGSSSIKYALLSEEGNERLHGLAENLGLDTARIKHQDLNGEKIEISLPGANHQHALQKILELLDKHYRLYFNQIWDFSLPILLIFSTLNIGFSKSPIRQFSHFCSREINSSTIELYRVNI